MDNVPQRFIPSPLNTPEPTNQASLESSGKVCLEKEGAECLPTRSRTEQNVQWAGLFIEPSAKLCGQSRSIANSVAMQLLTRRWLPNQALSWQICMLKVQHTWIQCETRMGEMFHLTRSSCEIKDCIDSYSDDYFVNVQKVYVTTRLLLKGYSLHTVVHSYSHACMWIN